MSQEYLQKVGRGGAGNFYSNKDPGISHVKAQDIEAQGASSTSMPDDLKAQSQASGYLRSGRGGAGNFAAPPDELHDPNVVTSMADNGTRPRAPAPKVAAGVRTESKVMSDGVGGLSGRGGAGNWKQGTSAEVARKAEEEKVQSAIHARVMMDLESGLRPPPKAYTAPENNIRG